MVNTSCWVAQLMMPLAKPLTKWRVFSGSDIQVDQRLMPLPALVIRKQ